MLSHLAALVALLAATGALVEAEFTTDRSSAFHGYSERSGGQGSTTKGCRDHNGSCDSWASQGECERNPGFMDKECPVSCKRCTPEPLKYEDYLGQSLVFQTSFGDIRIRPLFENAPRTSALVLELASQGACDGCNFYRNEAAAPDGGEGPPYGLLQGSLAGMLKDSVTEANKEGFQPTRGFAAMITGTTEFYIALVDHASWASAHTVWGEVLDMDVVDRIVSESAFEDFKHPTYGTVMRMMKTKVAFHPQAVKAKEDEL